MWAMRRVNLNSLRINLLALNPRQTEDPKVFVEGSWSMVVTPDTYQDIRSHKNVPIFTEVTTKGVGADFLILVLLCFASATMAKYRTLILLSANKVASLQAGVDQPRSRYMQKVNL